MPRPLPLLTYPDRKRSRAFAASVAGAAAAPSEQKWHAELVRDLRRIMRKDWRWTHFPAGGARDKKSGGVMQALGLMPGWPDLLFLAPASIDRPYAMLHGLELKKLGRTMTEEQEDLAAWFLANRLPFACVDTIDAARLTLCGWGALRIKMGGLARAGAA